VPFSWRIKVARAEHHLGDLERRLAPLEGRHTYSVSEVFKANNDFGRRPYVFLLNVPEAVDPLLPIIAGELMFNLRSALDHLAVAMVTPALRSRSTAFPIFTDDIEDTSPRDSQDLEREAREARKRWKRITKGFPDDAMPTVRLVQPYRHRREGRNPDHLSLARLSTYQNADKHNQLVVVASGITDLSLSLVGPGDRREALDHAPIPDGFIIGDGAQIGASEAPFRSDVKVEAEGTLSVQIGDGLSGDYLPCLEALSGMIEDTTGVLDRLDAYARHLPPPPGRAYTANDQL
jgi:hypothetical protein